MIDPAIPLQDSIIAAVKASTILQGLIGSPCRIYDRVPTKPVTFPYVSLGDISCTGGGERCDTGTDVDVSLDVWSRAVGRIEAATIGAALATLLDAELAVTGFRVSVHQAVSSRTDRQPDGLTNRCLVRLNYWLIATA